MTDAFRKPPPTSPDAHTLVRALREELEPGEKVLWTGQPNPGRYALPSFAVLLFGIPWTGFALFWMCAAAGFMLPDFREGTDLFPLFGLPFVLIGFLMLSAPYWARRKARNTVYALTPGRALILEIGRKKTVRSIAASRFDSVERIENPDGTGDLIFSKETRGSGKNTRTVSVGFLAIRDVKEVDGLVRETGEAAASRPANPA